MENVFTFVWSVRKLLLTVGTGSNLIFKGEPIQKTVTWILIWTLYLRSLQLVNLRVRQIVCSRQGIEEPLSIWFCTWSLVVYKRKGYTRGKKISSFKIKAKKKVSTLESDLLCNDGSPDALEKDPDSWRSRRGRVVEEVNEVRTHRKFLVCSVCKRYRARMVGTDTGREGVDLRTS